MIDDALIEYCVDMLDQLADMLDGRDEREFAAALRVLALEQRVLHDTTGPGLGPHTPHPRSQ